MATIRYLVADVPRAMTFYIEQLGFESQTEMLPAFASVRRLAMRANEDFRLDTGSFIFFCNSFEVRMMNRRESFIS